MAEFNVIGFNAFASDLEAAKALGKDEVYYILEEGGEVVKRAMQTKLTALGLVLYRRLVDSIKVVRKIAGAHDVAGGRQFVLIYPQGKHHSYHGRDSKGRRGKGSLKTADAAEVAFAYEYGAPGRHIPAYHWMEQAVAESEGEAAEVMQAAFDEMLDLMGVGRQ